MKAVFAQVPEHFLEERRRIGADRWDEMWEGVLHMPPSPNRAHQSLELSLASYLLRNWAQPGGNTVCHQLNVAFPGTWPSNYRVPDIGLVTPARAHKDKDTHFEGGPDAVIEIRSPGDESYEKLDFYAQVDVTEVWIIDQDSKETEIFVLEDGSYVKRSQDAAGWLKSEVAQLELKPTESGKLRVRIRGDESTQEDLPM